MSTHSTISIQLEDETLKTIYCHFDGYLEGVGKTLKEYFNTPELVNELINLGDCSAISKATNISEVVAYHRDRGENYQDVQATGYFSMHYLTKEEFNYVFRGGKWLFSIGESTKLVYF